MTFKLFHQASPSSSFLPAPSPIAPPSYFSPRRRSHTAAPQPQRFSLLQQNHFDPISFYLAPPRSETPREKTQRLKEEREAKKRSECIDKSLKEDGARARRARDEEKQILLLGQAEAGKTTILKQMRLLYNPTAYQAERASWRAIIQLNLITAVRVLLEIFEASQADERRIELPTRPATVSSPAPSSTSKRHLESKGSTSTAPLTVPSTAPPATSAGKNAAFLVRLRLAPLLGLESSLRTELGALGETAPLPADSRSVPVTPLWAPRKDAASFKLNTTKGNDLFLLAGWTSKLRSISPGRFDSDRMSIASSTNSQRTITSRLRRVSSHRAFGGARSEREQEGLASSANSCVLPPTSETTSLLLACKETIRSLWNEPFAQQLRQQNPSILNSGASDSTVYFLENLDRIASVDYQPTDQDVLHARVRTVGVTEEVFTIDQSNKVRVYDVGGSVSQRHVWSSYMEDLGISAILFLAPLSAFDQHLTEDPRVNRLADSLDLFEQVVENPLLRNVTLVLFLNKMDLLEAKLKSGIRVRDHFTSYKGRNEYEDVWRWFRKKFRAIADSATARANAAASAATAPGASAACGSAAAMATANATSSVVASGDNKRLLYVHTTVAISTKQIRAILCDVNDALLRENLNAAGLC
ncbi:G-alpha-domain-containing protein [Microstroma glucosiphilum]|uniref:G-alpha-domain-containing protein n=1 Tax=Pseudomicrostroma glucosiphilum TaxID=1684307 RepID=A0A316U6S4_9BASI|nr:G-alpha-domain-containing protein [Pseudomicrostroma glucosiphilum]PWN20043.1 G-alpha-domain-containing protein [Pseudomicrostroma glucosiphilum]